MLPAARRDALGLVDLARLTVVHGPRRASPGTYDAWLARLRSADPRVAFVDPPFRQSLPLTLAFAAAASRPTAVLTGPQHPAGQPAGDDQAADGCAMVRTRLDQAPLTASAGLAWNGDLPRPLQQIRFDLADGINLQMTVYPEPIVIPPPARELRGKITARRKPRWRRHSRFRKRPGPAAGPPRGRLCPAGGRRVRVPPLPAETGHSP